jgi:hypothetical protein
MFPASLRAASSSSSTKHTPSLILVPFQLVRPESLLSIFAAELQSGLYYSSSKLRDRQSQLPISPLLLGNRYLVQSYLFPTLLHPARCDASLPRHRKVQAAW